jgi:hypothetical protein
LQSEPPPMAIGPVPGLPDVGGSRRSGPRRTGLPVASADCRSLRGTPPSYTAHPSAGPVIAVTPVCTLVVGQAPPREVHLWRERSTGWWGRSLRSSLSPQGRSRTHRDRPVARSRPAIRHNGELVAERTSNMTRVFPARGGHQRSSRRGPRTRRIRSRRCSPRLRPGRNCSRPLRRRSPR